MVTISLFFAVALLVMMAVVSGIILFRGSDIDLIVTLQFGLAAFALILLLLGAITKDATMDNVGLGVAALTLVGAAVVAVAAREVRE